MLGKLNVCPKLKFREVAVAAVVTR